MVYRRLLCKQEWMIRVLKKAFFRSLLDTVLYSSPGCVLPGLDTLPVFSSLALWRMAIGCTIIFHRHRFSTPLLLVSYPLWLPFSGDCVPPCSLSRLGWLPSPHLLHLAF